LKLCVTFFSLSNQVYIARFRKVFFGQAYSRGPWPALQIINDQEHLLQFFLPEPKASPRRRQLFTDTFQEKILVRTDLAAVQSDFNLDKSSRSLNCYFFSC
jgi:hypothetical protein